jgi:hypothetical protein
MYLIQILLPTTNHSAAEPVLTALNRSLVEKFGGVTAYSQAPAKGNWLAGGTRSLTTSPSSKRWRTISTVRGGNSYAKHSNVI